MTVVLAAVLGLSGCRDTSDRSEPETKLAPAPTPPREADDVETDDDAYVRIRDAFEGDPAFVRGSGFDEARSRLRRIANEADDVHLRANASLLLGAMLEARGEGKAAIDQYRHAARLVTDDAGPVMALALALAADHQYAEAAKAQARAAELDPDNLENWLALGELRLKAGDADGSAQAYVDYERRRKGLIDGLTLKHGDAYRVSADDRAGCALALASATDQGTAVALAYALKTDPDPKVRTAVAEVMGLQHLAPYRPLLEEQLKSEPDATVRDAIAAALAEVVRDPVDPRSAPTPDPAAAPDPAPAK